MRRPSRRWPLNLSREGPCRTQGSCLASAGKPTHCVTSVKARNACELLTKYAAALILVNPDASIDGVRRHGADPCLTRVIFHPRPPPDVGDTARQPEIGRASCRERV